MKILFICHGAGNGGAERVISTLAQEFAKRNHSVMLYTTRAPYNDYELTTEIVRKWSETDGKGFLGRNIRIISDMRNNMKQFGPDCVISFSTIPNILALVSGMGCSHKIIISERTDPSKHPSSTIYRLLRKITYPRSDRIIFQTADARQYFSNSVKSKSSIIFNPIRSDLPERYDGIRRKLIVGIGSLSEQKNWDVALKACELFFDKYPDYEMRIYGEGPERTRLVNYVNNNNVLKKRVRFMGFSLDAVKDMNNAMMYVSSSDYEGISNSMLEALATGVPTICTDCPVGGARMFIDGSNGLLVPIRDSSALFEAMDKMASDEEFRDRASMKSIELKKQLELDNIVDQWEREVEKLCKN